MAEYDLPTGPAELFAAVRGTIGDHLGGERHMLLGGGTALAMRWAHRHSTDVDLFTSTEAFGRLFARRLRHDWMRRHDRQLIRPVHPEEALRAVAIVRRRISDVIDDRSPPRYRPPPPWER